MGSQCKRCLKLNFFISNYLINCSAVNLRRKLWCEVRIETSIYSCISNGRVKKEAKLWVERKSNCKDRSERRYTSSRGNQAGVRVVAQVNSETMGFWI